MAYLFYLDWMKVLEEELIVLLPSPSLSPTHSPILSLLIQEETAFAKGEKEPLNTSFSFFRLSKKRGFEILCSLLENNQLAVYKERKYSPTALIYNPYEKISAKFKIFINENGVLSSSLFFSSTKKTFSTESPFLIIPTEKPLLIHGISCYHLETLLAPSFFKEPLSKEQILFLHEKEDSLLEISEEASSLLFKPFKALPFLQLEDARGASASLWIEYEKEGSLSSPLEYGDTFASSQFKDAKGKTLGKRNLKEEAQWEKDLLETGFIKKGLGKGAYFCPLPLVSKSLSFLLELGWKILDYRKKKVSLCPLLQITSLIEKKEVLLKGSLSFDSHQFQLENMVGAFQKGSSFINLSQETFLFSEDSVTPFLLEEIKEKGKLTSKGIQLSTRDFLPFKEKKIPFPEEKKSVLPSSLFQGSLRPYQLEGLSFLYFLYQYGGGALLADDMGLGKTVQTLALASLILEEPEKLPLLIISPKSLVFNWKEEIIKFLPSAKIAHFHETRENLNLKEIDFILVSYHLLRSHLSFFTSLNFSMVVADEAHLIKNQDTQTFQAIEKLNSSFRLSITGTPVENKLEELFSQFEFLLPNFLGNKEAFLADTKASLLDFRYLQSIKRKIAPFFLRRKKEEVAKDLPPKIEQTVFIEMTEEQKETYGTFLQLAKQGLLKKIEREGAKTHRLEIFEMILRLRQLACHPSLFPSFLPEKKKTSGKLDAVLSDLLSIYAEGKKALVFSQFTSFLTLLKKELEERHIPFAYLDGSTTLREEEVHKFQREKTVPFFLLSLKAGGFGLNLTEADYVLLLDPWWNDAKEAQAIDRAHRIGQDKTVIAKKYISLDTIEEKMVKLKEAKKKLSSSLFDISLEEELSFTEEELAFLLS